MLQSYLMSTAAKVLSSPLGFSCSILDFFCPVLATKTACCSHWADSQKYSRLVEVVFALDILVLFCRCLKSSIYRCLGYFSVVLEMFLVFGIQDCTLFESLSFILAFPFACMHSPFQVILGLAMGRDPLVCMWENVHHYCLLVSGS